MTLMRIGVFFAVISVIFVPFEQVLGASMSSTNYKIQSDVIGPGALTTSTNYGVFGGIGEWQGYTTSSNYQVQGGFVGAQPTPTLSISVSAASLALGTLDRTNVVSASETVTVSTDAFGGYSLMITENNNLANGGADINPVSDGHVTAGAEEYGVGTTGSSGLYTSTDLGITTKWQAIARSSTPKSSDVTTVFFKAAIAGDTVAGSYSHTVTFAAVSNF